jgi:NitT/TauT family transport system permease protein
VGYLIALALASRRWMDEMLSPWVTFFQMIPVVILAPLCVLLLDQGLPSVVLITFLIGFFPVVANTAHAFASVDRGLIDLFAMCGAGPRDTLLQLKVPAALPGFLTGVRIAATLAPVGAITGDLFAGNKSGEAAGIGFLVQLYSAQYDIPAVYACALASCLLGFVFVTAVYLASWLLLRRWHESHLPREAD